MESSKINELVKQVQTNHKEYNKVVQSLKDNVFIRVISIMRAVSTFRI